MCSSGWKGLMWEMQLEKGSILDVCYASSMAVEGKLQSSSNNPEYEKQDFVLGNRGEIVKRKKFY